MVILRKFIRHLSLSRFDRLAFPTPSLSDYQEAVVKSRLTMESFIISFVNGSDSVLKSYNSYIVLPGNRLRPFLSNMDKAQNGTRVLVKRADNGELIGVLSPELV